MVKISSGSLDLDSFVKYEDFNIIYGPAGSGKTTLCLLASIEQAKNKKKVLYLDTEDSFPLERLKQLSKDENIMDYLIILKSNNFKDQHEKIKILKDLIKNKKISLIIVDTIGIHYRRLLKHNAELANSMLKIQLNILKDLSKEIPVIIANQVYSNMNGSFEIVSGNLIRNYPSLLIKLQKDPRKLILENEKKEFRFEIGNEGIVGR